MAIIKPILPIGLYSLYCLLPISEDCLITQIRERINALQKRNGEFCFFLSHTPVSLYHLDREIHAFEFEHYLVCLPCYGRIPKERILNDQSLDLTALSATRPQRVTKYVRSTKMARNLLSISNTK